MIERVALSGCTPYGTVAEVLDLLRAVNFIYGANGVGKTTVSRVIANPAPFPSCTVTWANQHQLETLVYNRDFVRDNFSESGKLKGIFTLGKEDIDVQNQIAQAKADSSAFLAQIAQLRNTLGGDDGNGGKRADLSLVEDGFRDECWKLKTKHASKLKDALRGVLNDKKAFKKRILEECGKTPSRPLVTQAELEEKAASLFGETPTTEPLLSTIDSANFLKWESDPILSRRILGKPDVDIAAIIQKLGNSDWVKQGVPYLESSEGVCPFCQQDVSDQLSASLDEYFDESFLKDTASLAALEAGYKLGGERLQQVMQGLATANPRFFDMDRFAAEKNIFDARLTLNLQRIAGKVKEPSQIVALEPLADVLQTLSVIVADTNSKLETHNTMVANLASERDRLSEDVWAFLAHTEIVGTYKIYYGKLEAEQKAIGSLTAKIAKAKEDREICEETVRQLEKTVTSIQPTVNEINRLLRGFGFRSFSLEAMSGNLYRLCRQDGSNAQETLSEGERSFITFLYFFHLLKGSTSEAGLSTDRVVVFDDPVSSLDSDVLFIVSSLIKQTLEEARAKTGSIKQVFVLTHNVYFFKEVVFDAARSGDASKHYETFWTIRKVNDVSSVLRHQSVPIKTSYELLWTPLREPNLADQSLQNNMRRILEHYFRILGGVNFDDIASKFEGGEKLICRSLLSWVHDGSHSIPDDLFHSLDESAMQRYIAVFQAVFIRMGHANHYNMMMGIPYAIVSEV
jgi:wobble nucleotide-excising tRNase